MLPPLLKQDLDAFRCPNPECTGEHPIALVPSCHPRAGVIAVYHPDRGVIQFACHECKTEILEVEVAAAPVH
jgi:hypothetical protein